MMIFGGGGKDDARQRAIDEQFAAQQAILARRRNPRAREQYYSDVEKRREDEGKQWFDKLAWQSKADTKDFNKLDEFKRRQASGQVKKLGYEDQPKARVGLTLPLASFGVGGEFGQGGKYDNGERFDLRLPYVDMGWIDESERKPAKPQRDARAQKSSKQPRAATPPPQAAPSPFDWLFGKK